MNTDTDGNGNGNGVNRRQFLTLMGASAALAGLTACRWPIEKIAPYTGNDPEQVPGMPRRFATMMDLGGVAAGLLVTSYDGRPVKIEGNPDHPINAGATTAIQQATILDLYDPDRSQQVRMLKGDAHEASSWSAFQAALATSLAAMPNGQGLAVLARASSSDTQLRLRTALKAKYPQMQWVEFESISRDNERDGSKLAFGGRAFRTHYHTGNAKVVVAFDGDLFDGHPAAIRHAREFFAKRRCSIDEHATGDKRIVFHDAAGNTVPNPAGMSRLYAIESGWSHTGTMADHRFATKSGNIPMLVQQLAKMLGVPGVAEAGGIEKIAGSVHLGKIAEDVRNAGANALVCAGATQPPAVHALCHAINAHLKSTCVSYTNDADPDRPSHAAAIEALSKSIESGAVRTLLILGGNPVFEAPADCKFAERIESIKKLDGGMVIHHGQFFNFNETAKASTWHLPETHFLESWGDGRAWDGTKCSQQPLIQPLYEGKSAIELLALLLGGDTPTRGYDLVRANAQMGGAAGQAWRQSLFAGVSGKPADKAIPGAVQNIAGIVSQLPPAGSEGTELSFVVDYRMHDGRFVNNGWLVELPEFFTTLTWDNALLISPTQADQLGLRAGDMVEVSTAGGKIELPAWLHPGQAPDSVAIWLGYGRVHRAQRFSQDEIVVGVSVEPLRTTASFHMVGATLKKTGRKYPLSSTQLSFKIREDSIGFNGQQQRVPTLIRETSLDNYTKDPHFVDFADHIPPAKPLSGLHYYSEWLRPGEEIVQPARGKTDVKDYNHGQQWGMAIDLSACIGCGACVAACNAENNIPVVGKTEISLGREMHWIRVDRYFAGNDMVQPPVTHQPMTCLQCENAPCEQVCPVAATSHSDEGTNDMVYNRCIGTRYCMNNCPVKVRKFNFFYNNQNLTEVMKMRFNPQVTVRTRGVMEKCSYCQQRIQAAKIEARTSGKMKSEVQRVNGQEVTIQKPDVADGTIITACQQSCPTHAITFGDLNQYDRANPADQSKWSAVRRLQHKNRSYELLGQLNLRARTQYLGRVRNPNPAIPDKTEPGSNGANGAGH
ncbi:MAG: 4Fe-4S dicluster domain-containing protein [Planctomycetota bacterium]